MLASIGASIFPIDGDDGETLLRRADVAMYRAKSRGGDAFQLFTRAMSRRAVERSRNVYRRKSILESAVPLHVA